MYLFVFICLSFFCQYNILVEVSNITNIPTFLVFIQQCLLNSELFKLCNCLQFFSTLFLTHTHVVVFTSLFCLFLSVLVYQ